jgi:hypothetical protein
MEIISIIASLSGLFIAGVNCAIFIIIKFNDLRHQEETLKRIETKLEVMDKKGDKTAEKVATLEGRCLANHG